MTSVMNSHGDYGFANYPNPSYAQRELAAPHSPAGSSQHGRGTPTRYDKEHKLIFRD